MAEHGVDGPVGRKGIEQPRAKRSQRRRAGGQVATQPPRPASAQQIARQQERPVAAEDRAHQQRHVGAKGQIDCQHQRLADQGMEEVISIEHQVDAQGIPDQLRVQRAGERIDQRVLEVPDVPEEGRLVIRPLRYAGDVRRQMTDQRPRQDQRQQRIEGENKAMVALRFRFHACRLVWRPAPRRLPRVASVYHSAAGKPETARRMRQRAPRYGKIAA